MVLFRSVKELKLAAFIPFLGTFCNQPCFIGDTNFPATEDGSIFSSSDLKPILPFLRYSLYFRVIHLSYGLNDQASLHKADHLAWHKQLMLPVRVDQRVCRLLHLQKF